MKPNSLSELGDLQKEVMEIVWRLGEAGVHQVRDQLTGEREPAYTTVLSVMQKLEKAGWLTHRHDGRAYVYGPTRSRQEAGIQSIRGLASRVFRGDPRVLFQHLVADEDITDEDLQEFRKMISRRKKGLNHD